MQYYDMWYFAPQSILQTGLALSTVDLKPALCPLVMRCSMQCKSLPDRLPVQLKLGIMASTRIRYSPFRKTLLL